MQLILMERLHKRHPLYEDVNWNELQLFADGGTGVILYMRMWIEMCWYHSNPAQQGVILYMRMWIEIEPCPVILFPDLVILYMRMWIEMLTALALYSAGICHPLYEDVNWNSLTFLLIFLSSVILYMRMWIEMSLLLLSADRCIVILYMRMWIEILRSHLLNVAVESSSIWGCELKCGKGGAWYGWKSHPLYEDVNWNANGDKTYGFIQSHPLYEDVNWNSWCTDHNRGIICHPLYEDVNWNISVYLFIRLSPCHPLYEDVNWNTPSRRDNISARVSSSIWGCELKYHVIGI